MRGNQLALVEEQPEGVAEVPVPVEVQTFESPFGKARVVMFSDGTPWFVAKDAAEGLGLNVKGTSSHIRHLKDDQKQLLERSLISNDIPRGLLLDIFGEFAPRVLLITRGGFNDMVMESRKPVAREYRQWVTDEVLPALQDTGTFTDKSHQAQQKQEGCKQRMKVS